MVRIGDYIYAGSGHNNGLPICIEWKTGKVVWKERGPGRESAAVIAADGELYFRYQDGVMQVAMARLGGNSFVINPGQGSWQLETRSGVTMLMAVPAISWFPLSVIAAAP